MKVAQDIGDKIARVVMAARSRAAAMAGVCDVVTVERMEAQCIADLEAAIGDAIAAERGAGASAVDPIESTLAEVREQVSALRSLYPDHDDKALALACLRRAEAYEGTRTGVLLGLVGTVLHFAAKHARKDGAS